MVFNKTLSRALGTSISRSISNPTFGSDTTISPEYQQIKDLLPFDPHHWFSQDNADHLARIIAKKNIKTIIEIGSWLGGSTRFMAQKLPEKGILYAIDTWEGSEEHLNGYCQEKLPTLYAQFLSNVIHAGLQTKIRPIRTASLAAAALDIQADLIFIDGAHDETSVYNDIKAWYPHLTKQGIICGDDWTWPSVRLGVERAAQELDMSVVHSYQFWYYQPKDGSLDNDIKLKYYFPLKIKIKQAVKYFLSKINSSLLDKSHLKDG